MHDLYFAAQALHCTHACGTQSRPHHLHQPMHAFCCMPNNCMQCAPPRPRQPASLCRQLLRAYRSSLSLPAQDSAPNLPPPGPQVHRIAHHLWHTRQQLMARALQSRVSEVFSIDIHPAARLGSGLLLDHGSGVVIGETAAVGNNVSIMQGVTLGGAAPVLAAMLQWCLLTASETFTCCAHGAEGRLHLCCPRRAGRGCCLCPRWWGGCSSHVLAPEAGRCSWVTGGLQRVHSQSVQTGVLAGWHGR